MTSEWILKKCGVGSETDSSDPGEDTVAGSCKIVMDLRVAYQLRKISIS
jgi:hypothetical protein